MDLFNQLKQQLSEKLQRLTASQGVIKLSVEYPYCLESTPCWLSWLKGQSHFPQYFWQNRTQETTFCAIGAVRHFSQLEEAEQFSRQSQFPLFGGIQFEGDSQFILPRLLIAKNSEKVTACLFLDSDHLIEERLISEQILAQTAHYVPIEPLANQLLGSQSACDFSDWQQNIAKAISHIQQLDFHKVVLANAVTRHFQEPVSPYDLLAASRQKNLGCYHFLWRESAQSAFVGSSPERLYYREDRDFYTEALAGTVAVTADLAQTERNAFWLLNDQKNIHENLLVVEDICTHLADCVADIQVSDVEIKRLHNVQHLRRKIYTKLAKQVNDSDCLARIHPTAAVAGLPRMPAKQFIRQHEGFSRGWYAGTLGYFMPDKAEFCVALRSALICENHITFYAGAGIVEGSQAESEWQEIERKSQALASLLTSDSSDLQNFN